MDRQIDKLTISQTNKEAEKIILKKKTIKAKTRKSKKIYHFLFNAIFIFKIKSPKKCIIIIKCITEIELTRLSK